MYHLAVSGWKPLVLSLILCGVACSSTDKMFQKRPVSSDIGERETQVRELAHRILKGLMTGDYIKLTETNATGAMIIGFNEEVQQYAAFQTMGIFGDYIGIGELSEVIDQRTDKLWIYRFKGNFEGELDAEVRVVFDHDFKMAGFFVLPWKDDMK